MARRSLEEFDHLRYIMSNIDESDRYIAWLEMHVQEPSLEQDKNTTEITRANPFQKKVCSQFLMTHQGHYHSNTSAACI